MTKYQLAKLVMMAGTLESRKRVQKTVHLLQAAGCDFGAEFRLHYYGPYSADLADRLDRMVSADLLEETECPTQVGTQYNYRFNDEARASLEAYEQTPNGKAAKAELEGYQCLLEDLRKSPSRVLELASTTVAYHQAGASWKDALKETAEFKGETIGSQKMKDALSLAQRVVGADDG